MLAEAAYKLLTQPELAEHMGQNGAQLVRQKYLWSDICPSVERIYTSVVK